MKTLLILALKINIFIQFDYAEYKGTLSEPDAEWVVSSLKNACHSSIPNCDIVNPIQIVHGYRKIQLIFPDGVPSVLKSIIGDRKEINIKTGKVNFSENKALFIQVPDFEYELIKKVLEKNPEKDWDINITDYYYKQNHNFTSLETRCDTIIALDSQKPDFIIPETNLDSWLGNNQCLNWALGIYNEDPNGIRTTIGRNAKQFNCKALIKILTENHLLYLGNDFNDCDNKKEIIALVVDPIKGYHFFRKDNNHLWSHKAGDTFPSKRDYAYRLIRDPSKSHNGPFEHFCGYFIKDKSFTKDVRKINNIQQKLFDSVK